MKKSIADFHALGALILRHLFALSMEIGVDGVAHCSIQAQVPDIDGLSSLFTKPTPISGCRPQP